MSHFHRTDGNIRPAQDAERLPAEYVVAVHSQRWRMEDADAIAKHLPGLAYLWSGAY